jgi:hypothetical protein
VLKQAGIRGLKFTGFLIAAVGTSALLQSVFINPAYSEGPPHDPNWTCTSLTPPGPGQVVHCVDPEEQKAILQEIARNGDDASKFAARLTVHAHGSLKGYADALGNMHPMLREEIRKYCYKAGYRKGLVFFKKCYVDALDIAEKEADKIEEVFYTEVGSTGDELETQLKDKKHFAGKILEEQCGPHPTDDCFENNLLALHQELIDAHDSMAASFDEQARWGILAAACDKAAGKAACKAAGSFSTADFVPEDASQVAYAPPFYRLPGAKGVFVQPNMVEQPVLGKRNYQGEHSRRALRRRHSRKRRRRHAGTGVTSSSGGSGPSNTTGSTIVAAPKPKVPAPKEVYFGPEPDPNAGKHKPKKPKSPPRPVTPGTTMPAVTPNPPVSTSTPGTTPSPSATPGTQTTTPPAGANTAPPTPPGETPPATVTPPPATGGTQPQPAPQTEPPAQQPGSSGGGGEGHGANLGSETAQGKPGSAGLGGSVQGDSALDCSDKSKADYQSKARQNRRNILFAPVVIMGETALYACTVKESYSDNPQAVFLARIGVRTSNLVSNVFHGTIQPQDYTQAIQDTLAEVGQLKQIDTSPELAALEADLQEFAAMGPGGVQRIFNDGAMQNRYTRDFCAWKKLLESAHPGSTAGFSPYLATCP